MTNLCGCKEKCFKNGEKRWGHLGGFLCEHAQEDSINGEPISKCALTGETVNVYINAEQYLKLKQ